MMGLTELRRGIAALGDLPSPLEIKVGSLAVFTKAIEAYCGDLVKDEATRVVTAKFCGVDVVENEYLPKNMAAVMHDGQIIQLIRFTDG